MFEHQIVMPATFEQRRTMSNLQDLGRTVVSKYFTDSVGVRVVNERLNAVVAEYRRITAACLKDLEGIEKDYLTFDRFNSELFNALVAVRQDGTPGVGMIVKESNPGGSEPFSLLAEFDEKEKIWKLLPINSADHVETEFGEVIGIPEADFAGMFEAATFGDIHRLFGRGTVIKKGDAVVAGIEWPEEQKSLKELVDTTENTPSPLASFTEMARDEIKGERQLQRKERKAEKEVIENPSLHMLAYPEMYLDLEIVDPYFQPREEINGGSAEEQEENPVPDFIRSLADIFSKGSAEVKIMKFGETGLIDVTDAFAKDERPVDMRANIAAAVDAITEAVSKTRASRIINPAAVDSINEAYCRAREARQQSIDSNPFLFAVRMQSSPVTHGAHSEDRAERSGVYQLHDHNVELFNAIAGQRKIVTEGTFITNIRSEEVYRVDSSFDGMIALASQVNGKQKISGVKTVEFSAFWRVSTVQDLVNVFGKFSTVTYQKQTCIDPNGVGECEVIRPREHTSSTIVDQIFFSPKKNRLVRVAKSEGGTLKLETHFGKLCGLVNEAEFLKEHRPATLEETINFRKPELRQILIKTRNGCEFALPLSVGDAVASIQITD